MPQTTCNVNSTGVGRPGRCASHIVHSMQESKARVESYNGIIKNNVNGSSSLLELESVVERLLLKESRFISLNEAIGKLLAS